MDIGEFASYCMDNASNIYIVEFGKVTSLAEARDKDLPDAQTLARTLRWEQDTGTIKGSTPYGLDSDGPTVSTGTPFRNTGGI